MRFNKQLTVPIVFLYLIVTLLFIGCGNDQEKITNNLSKDSEQKKIKELIFQRDEAIQTALKIKKDSKELSNKKSTAIQNIENARDEAIFISLGIQQENTKLKSKIDRIDRDYKQEVKYYKKTVNMLREEEDRDKLKKELKRYKSENRNLQSNIKRVQRSLELEIRDITKEAKSKIRIIDNLKSKIQKHEVKNIELEKKLTKSKTEVDKAMKLAIFINKDLNTKVVQSQKKSDEAIRLTLNINREKKELDAKNKELNNKIAKLLNNQNNILNTNKAPIAKNFVNALNIPKVEFENNSAILTQQSNQLLDKIVSIIKEYPEYNYEIQGHTDSNGNELYNLNLSVERAKSVNDYLVSKGVEDGSLSYKGFGSADPIADNTNRAGRDKNRRVLIKIK